MAIASVDRTVTLGELLPLCKVHPDFDDCIQDYLHEAYNFDLFLLKYFQDTAGFRSMQAKSGAIWSGSEALRFLGRYQWQSKDSDLYCEE